MKRLACVLITVLIFVSSAFMSGCSDFEFNPVGHWRLTDDILYADGQEIEHDRPEDMAFKYFEYVFGKTGTGYIAVNGTKTFDFTYEYEGNTVTVLINDPYSGKKPEENKNIFSLSDSGSLVRTETGQVDADHGKTIEIKEEFILQRQ